MTALGTPLRRRDRRRRHRRRRPAASRRCRSLLPALPADAAGGGVRRAAPAARAAEPAGRDLSSRSARVPVREAEDKEPVEPGTVYFAPPDYHLLVDRGPQLALSADEPVNFSRPSIDVLFESAADVYGERLLGIILTGANHDGAAGLDGGAPRRRLHRRAATRTTAQVPLMVESALQRGPVDYVLPLDEIADAAARRSIAAAHGNAADSAPDTWRWTAAREVPARRRPRGEPARALGAAAPRRRRDRCTARSGAEALELLLAHDVALALARRADARHGRLRAGRADARQRADAARADHLRHRRRRDQHRLFKGYDTGAVDFLYKPIEPHILRNKAERLLPALPAEAAARSRSCASAPRRCA